MKKVFITYGDQKYKDSLQRIKKEAEALEIFDEIHLYNDKLLPDLFQEYVRQYERGGGYWLWKPYVLFDALSKVDEGDIIVYADAGCTLLRHTDWKDYFRILKRKEAIFFITKGKNKKWCKKEVFTFFNPNNSLWRNAYQIQATFFMIKKTKSNEVIKRWYQLATTHPHLFIDIHQDERFKENPSVKEHRHDQAVLTGCICMSKDLRRYYLIPERMEKRLSGGQAVLASRISAEGIRGADMSSPVENPFVTYINKLTENPLRKLRTLLFFYLSRISV